jgi:hypothetical protein
MLDDAISKSIKTLMDDITRSSLFGTSTATNTQSKPLTEDDIKKAFELVEPYEPSFNEIWCNTASIKQAIEDAGGVWQQGRPPIESFKGIPVVLRENMPDMLLLVKQTGNPFETPEIFGIVNIEVKE